MQRIFAVLAVALSASLAVGFQPLPQRSFVGPNPYLPTPAAHPAPVVNYASTIGWPPGEAPHAPPGFSVTKFAAGLDRPRWLYQLPDGDILVAEVPTSMPRPRSLAQRVADWLKGWLGAQSAITDRIVLLRDSKDRGVADLQTTFLTQLHKPFGMLLLGNRFYVGDTDAIIRYPYRAGETSIAETGTRILALPEGGYNNHWTRNIVADAAGAKLYIAVGSGSNAGEYGPANEFHRADILEINPDGSGLRVFASGLRNPTGMAWEPQTHALWTVVNERDMLGNDLVPDYLTHVVQGAFYGWPYSYWGAHRDPRVQQSRPDLVASALTPDYSLGSHVAPLGLAFYTATAFPPSYRGGAFIGEHGSWNRKPFAGYKVVYVPFRGGMPSGNPQDFLTGFMPSNHPGIAYGRPVGVIVAQDGALLVADDVGNCIWRVAAR